MERFHNTFSVCFYCRKTKMNKEKLAPVEIGINWQGERFFINSSIRYNPKDFAREMVGRKPTELREKLSVIEKNILRYETECLSDGETITVQGIKDYIKNGYQRPGKSIGDMFKGFTERLATRANQDVRQKYARIIAVFTKECKLDLKKPAASITVGMVGDFCEWLDGNFKNSSAAGMKARLKCVLRYGLDNGYYKVNPFQERIIKKEVQIVPLNEEEVERIKDLDLSMLPRLERVKDLFVFSCYSGLSYCDTQTIVPEDIKCENGTYYINKGRAKTGVKYMVVLLPEALEILKKYDWRIPRISNQKTNSYLFEIQTLCRIDKRLHFHLARHTAACMYLNKYGFKTEVTAKILGHSSIRVSQHYQKMFNNTVFQAFETIKYD